MYSDEFIASKTRVVNGGSLFLPSRKEWNDILEGFSFLGYEVALVNEFKDWIAYGIGLSEKHAEIQMGLYHHGLKTFGLLPIVLLEIGGELQRVHIESLLCESCGWIGATANPMLPELYDHAVWIEQTRSAERFKVMPCPRCKD